MPLEKLPDHRETVIVVGTTCRKPLPILRAHLETLAYQELPDRVRLHYVYVGDFTSEQELAKKYLAEWVTERGGEILRGLPSPINDFAEGPQYDSHQWSLSAMQRVGANKNLIIQRALALKADYLFFCDADLLLDRTTLASLLAAEKAIATAVYWTRWSKRGTETRQVHAAPQVWLRHPYSLDGRGMDEAEFRKRLTDRELTRVWGFGACTLLERRVLEAGIDFSPLPDVPQTGMMAGEDRHFCIKCERAHLEAWADPWPDIQHLYHSEDEELIPEALSRLSTTHRWSPRLGDLVSLRLRALEPVPVSPGKFQHMPPQWVRGRLGALPLAPEIEEALLDMRRGDKRIVRVHFPISHPAPFLRLRTRLVEVSLIDCKDNRPAPVVENELLVGVASGRVMDTTALNESQHESIREVANG